MLPAGMDALVGVKNAEIERARACGRIVDAMYLCSAGYKISRSARLFFVSFVEYLISIFGKLAHIC